MQSKHLQERRRAQRLPLVTFCPAYFTYKNKQYMGMMLNVSVIGARFRAEPAISDLKMEQGAEIEYKIKTKYGDSICKGKVVWTSTIDGHYTWGTEFINVSDDKTDPLHRLIDSFF